jgi:hypothetical protein
MSQIGSKTWWKPSITTFVLVFCCAAGMVSVAAPPVVAAPARVQAGSVPVREIAKRVLLQTSIDGPGFSSLSDYVPSAQPAPPGSIPATAIAWTGTDPNHLLNVIFSADGLDYSQHKITLPENSATHPAVLLFNNTVSGTLAPNLVVLAWTGTDPNHSLNILFDVYGLRQKLTLRDNSLHSPALAFFGGQVWLAWTGTDPNHSLNVMAMGSNGLTPGHKTILSGTVFSSSGGPALRADMRDKQLLLSWTLSAAPHFIDLAQSTDGLIWMTSFAPPPPQTSGSGPDVLSVPGTVPTGLPTDFWTWTGTDVGHSLNIAFTTTLASWPAPIVTLHESGLGSPALGFSNKIVGLNPPNTVIILLAWTGADPAHHLNVALMQIG